MGMREGPAEGRDREAQGGEGTIISPVVFVSIPFISMSAILTIMRWQVCLVHPIQTKLLQQVLRGAKFVQTANYFMDSRTDKDMYKVGRIAPNKDA